VSHSKAFAECFTGFAGCFRHSTKQLIPIVKGDRRLVVMGVYVDDSSDHRGQQC
jgi:hypothetical protein